MTLSHRKHNVLHLLWIYLILISTATRTLAEDESKEARATRSCRSIFRRPGSCVSLRECAPLVKLVKEFPLVGRQIISASICSIPAHVRRPKALVCCPRVRSDDNGSSEESSSTSALPPPPATSSPPPSNRLLRPPQCGFSDKPHDRVVGGNPSAVGAWPWLAALGYGISPKYVIFQCGGTLVSSRHVLTAAHCVYRLELQVVRLGAHKINSNDPDDGRPMDVLVEKTTIHPDFRLETLENDIAVLRLNKDVKFTDVIHPICLPASDDLRNNSFINKYPFVAGWGATTDGGPSSEVLREVQIPVVDHEKCKGDYSRVRNTVIDERVLCAGYAQGGKDACQGDSGGPLMYPQQTTWYLIGIVSGGYSCAKPGFPGIYTRVTHFLQFIESNLN